MVNTRRMETGGSAPEGTQRHQTRSSNDQNTELNSSSSESEIEEESQGEEEVADSWSSREKKPLESRNNKIPSRVRELRNRFVCNELKYAKHRLRKTAATRNRQIRFARQEKHSLRVYSSRKMHGNIDLYNGNDYDNDYNRSHGHRTRNRHIKAHLTRLERRTALSLRPIGIKSYADDTHSPGGGYHSDDSDADKNVRRSKRNRKNDDSMSWLADNQMHKVGYPNLDTQEFFEEDSRDAQDHHPSMATRRNGLEESRRSTRHMDSARREIKKNPKYLYDFETEPPGHSLRRRSDKTRSQQESMDKENKDLDNSYRLNGRLRRHKEEKENLPDEHTEDEAKATEPKKNDKTISIKEEKVEDNEEITEQTVQRETRRSANKNNKQEDRESSESEEEMPRLRGRPPKINRMTEKFSQRRNQNRKSTESSSCSEASMAKGYSLRDRPPKPVQNNTELLVSSRRRFNRRRRKSAPSSSDSTDSEDICRKPKYSKNANEQAMKSGAGGKKPMPIGPETLDANVRFSSVGGLDGHISCLKEMILFPMLYPEVFKKYQIQPPRGVLFHGPPGTGKTLIARALANECSFGSRKVSFFMRKGADLLSKWIGESEKQLRLLFEQAQEMKPSIIFFDELDGLAPVRSSRQDQVHASIVSTLLALMDGLDNRGEVIVIGATNRIDAIDPALRRPGRFDRELYFPLPARKEREEILRVHISKWSCKPSDHLVSYLAEHAVGYCGSDLRALCSEAVIQSFRRVYPQVYNSDFRLLLDPELVTVDKVDFLRAKSQLVPASHRVANSLGRKLLPILNPILSKPLQNVISILEKSFPHGVNPQLAKVKLAAGFRPAQLLLTGDGPEHGHTTHLAPAILFTMEHIHAYTLDLSTLYRESGRSPEECCIQVFHEVRRNVPSILYIPCLDHWWSLASETVRAIFRSQLQELDPNSPVMILATADSKYEELPYDLRYLFSQYRNEVFQVELPNTEGRREFLKPLIIDACLKPPRPPRLRLRTPPPLPRAPTPPPTPVTEEVAKKLYEQEERTLRELRIFLRDMCKKLANNKLFYMFTKPVDLEEVPDYTTIIKQPMDLETMMTKVDFHRYECARDFLDDIELIVQNALEYNPAKTSADKQIRHRACSLRDYAFTLIKKEMDSDFEDKCQDIAKKRKERKASVTKYLPPYIYTPATAEMPGLTDELKAAEDGQENGDHSKIQSTPNSKISPNRKRKYTSWQRGNIQKKRKRKLDQEDKTDDKSSEDECKENHLDDCDKTGMDTTSSPSNETSAAEGSNDVQIKTEPLSIDCDLLPPTLTNSKFDAASPSNSPSKRRLSDIMSPSEMLEDPLEVDDIDQALNEVQVEDPIEKLQIRGIREELEKVLDRAVNITDNHHLHSLLDLHYQLSRIVKQYLRINNREQLPKDLDHELSRFHKVYKRRLSD